MVYAILKGGLGNQLFQYAAAKRLADRYDGSFKLVTKYYETHHDRKGQIGNILNLEPTLFTNELPQSSILRKLVSTMLPWYKRHYIQERGEISDKQFMQFAKETLIDGYWQTTENAQWISEELKAATQRNMRRNAANKVAVHFRGGDYFMPSNSQYVLSPNYYEKAFQALAEKQNNLEFHLFSDDRDKFNYSFLANYNCIWKSTSNELKDFKEMCLYQHFIIANSTFSWWAAFINKDGSTVAPKIWKRDQRENNHLLNQNEWIVI